MTPGPYPSFAELRRTPRLLLEAPATRLVGEKAIAERLINLSSSGVGLRTLTLLQPGRLERLSLGRLTLDARVVQVRRSGRPGQFEAGLRFTSPDVGELKLALRAALEAASDARAGPRLQLDVPAFWSGATGKSAGTVELLNLGLGGAMVRGPAVPEAGAPFILDIYPPEGQQRVAVPARVVWSRKAGAAQRLAGVAFAAQTRAQAVALLDTFLWTPRLEPPSGSPGRTNSRIGGFQTGGLLRRGRTHEVYAATALDPSAETDGMVEVALRRFSGDAREVAQWSERFIAAAEVGSQLLGVPGVLRVYGATSGRDDCFLTTDRIEGTSFDQTLAQLAQQRDWPALEPVLEVIGEVLRTLNDCHQLAIDGSQQLFHGDLRPSNILLGSTGEVRLIGFGCAPLELEPQTVRPPPDRLAYLPPELFRDGGSPNAASDVFQTAVMLYEAIAGARPFQPVSAEHQVKLVAAGPMPVVRLNPQVPSALDALVAQALSIEPRARPSVPEFLSRLRAVVLPVAIGSQPTDPAGYLQKVLEHSGQNAAHRPLGADRPAPTRRTRKELGPGAWLGRYRLLGKVAEGGMAVVYLARPMDSEKTLVLKTLLPAENAKLESIKLFLNEARVAAVLNHPNIVQLLDFGFDQGRPYIALEYIEGRTLSQVQSALKSTGRPFPPSLAARVIAESCKGLAYAHAVTDPEGNPMGVIHRDMSSKNILISYSGEVRVLDFGIAKFRGSAELTLKGMLRGTVDYVAPEQATAGPLTRSVDLWALGVNLYELLTGALPFAGPSFDETLYAVVHHPFSPAHERNPAAPAELSAVTQRALEKDVEARYPDAEAMAADLERYLASHPASPAELAALLNGLFPTGPNTERERLARLERGEAALSPRGVVPAPAGLEGVTDPQVAVPTRVTVPPPVVEQRDPPTVVAVPRRARPRWQVVAMSFAAVLSVGVGVVALGPARREPPLIAAPVAAVEPVAFDAGAEMDAGVADEAAVVELSCTVSCTATFDDRPLGSLPQRVTEVSPGTHRLSFTGSTPFGTAIKEVELTVGANEVAKSQMSFGTGTLSVFAPPGSTVVIFGKKRGRRELKALTLIEGTHEVMVVGAKAVSRKEMVKILPGKTARLKIRW